MQKIRPLTLSLPFKGIRRSGKMYSENIGWRYINNRSDAKR